jgi:phospholipid/cholesterol/gamma-HCH transport system substrate-binding protein
MKRRTEATVGLVTIFAFILLVVFTINIKKALFFSRTYDINVYFKRIKGLSVGSPVNVYGVVAGEVSKIEYVHGERPVKVVISVKSNIRIYNNAVIRVATSGLIGETYIEIDAGTADHRVLAADSSFPGADLVDMYDVLSLTPTIVEDISVSIKSFRELVTDEKTKESLTNTIARMDSITARLDSLLTDSSSNVNDAVENLKNLTERTSALIDRIDRIVASSEPDIRRARSSLYETIENIRRETDGILKETNSILDRVSTTTFELNSFIRTNKAELTRLSTNLGEASQAVNQIVAKIDQGRGTIGLLVNDPQPFYSLRDTLAAIQRLLLGPQPDVSLLQIPYEQRTPATSPDKTPGNAPSPKASGLDVSPPAAPSGKSSPQKTRP